MINPETVLVDDLNEASMEAQCIRDCLREALIGDITGDHNMVKSRVRDAQKSIDRLDKLKRKKKQHDQLKESFRLAGEFLTVEAIERYEMQMRRGG